MSKEGEVLIGKGGRTKLCLDQGKVKHGPGFGIAQLREVFQVECDASVVGIGNVLSQDNRLVVFFYDKVCEAQSKWSTYELGFFVVV